MLKYYERHGSTYLGEKKRIKTKIKENSQAFET